MNCPICNHKEFQNVDEFNYRDLGMQACMNCGFVTIPSRFKDNTEAKEYYRKEYRGCPSANDFFAQQNKMIYHDQLLTPHMAEYLKNHERTDVHLLDVGAAYGVFLHWVKQAFGVNVYGTEWTEGYKRNAFHEFGLRLTDEIDESRKYNVIASYHVLEHQIDPHLELKRYSELLTDDGFLYLSTPTWFYKFHNFGGSGCSLNEYYHKDHINMWTEQNLEYMIHKAGFQVFAKNSAVYGTTYVCKKGQSEKEVKHDSAENVLNRMSAIFEAYKCYEQKDFKKAIEIFDNFPMAWKSYYEMNRQAFDKNGFEWIEKEVLQPMSKACVGHAEIILYIADICMRYDQFPLAVTLLQEGLKHKHNWPPYLQALARAYRELAVRVEAQERANYVMQARDINKKLMSLSPRFIEESLSWIYQDNANLPIPSGNK